MEGIVGHYSSYRPTCAFNWIAKLKLIVSVTDNCIVKVNFVVVKVIVINVEPYMTASRII